MADLSQVIEVIGIRVEMVTSLRLLIVAEVCKWADATSAVLLSDRQKVFNRRGTCTESWGRSMARPEGLECQLVLVPEETCGYCI
jgi:hypothetical protein